MKRAFAESTEAVHRSAIEAELSIVTQDLARATAEVQRLQAEKSEAAAQVSSEQTRWAEINQRLEELDRADAPLNKTTVARQIENARPFARAKTCDGGGAQR